MRIILTEEPKGGLTKDKILVDGADVSVVKGATYKGGHPTYAIASFTVGTGNNQVTVPAVTVPKRDSELTPAMVNYYHVNDDASAAVTTPVADAETADNGTVANFPEATGRDNMYHSYIATITPKPGRTDPVTISIAAFEDNVLPVSKKYVPLTAQQRAATTLTAAALHVRDGRVKNESLTVRVSAAKDTKVEDATAAYDKRQKDVLDKVANEITLGNKLYIPAGGYLVLVGDRGKAGIAGSAVKNQGQNLCRPESLQCDWVGIALPSGRFGQLPPQRWDAHLGIR